MAGWSTERVTGNAADFHARVPDAGAGRQAWWYAVEQPAIAIGSAQPVETIDMVACAQLGIEVVRRRSGGGAVLLLPGQILWLDVLIPLGDPLWDDDIGRSMWWFGEVWARSLRALGETEVAVHHGPLVPTAWSRTVCFDGLGSGEVVVGTAKAVGISQRRTRSWARLQSAVHVVWRPDVMVSLLSDPRPVVAELGPVWSVPVGREVGALVDAVDAALTAAE